MVEKDLLDLQDDKDLLTIMEAGLRYHDTIVETYFLGSSDTRVGTTSNMAKASHIRYQDRKNLIKDLQEFFSKTSGYIIGTFYQTGSPLNSSPEGQLLVKNMALAYLENGGKKEEINIDEVRNKTNREVNVIFCIKNKFPEMVEKEWDKFPHFENKFVQKMVTDISQFPSPEVARRPHNGSPESIKLYHYGENIDAYKQAIENYISLYLATPVYKNPDDTDLSDYSHDPIIIKTVADHYAEKENINMEIMAGIVCGCPELRLEQERYDAIKHDPVALREQKTKLVQSFLAEVDKLSAEELQTASKAWREAEAKGVRNISIEDALGKPPLTQLNASAPPSILSGEGHGVDGKSTGLENDDKNVAKG